MKMSTHKTPLRPLLRTAVDAYIATWASAACAARIFALAGQLHLLYRQLEAAGHRQGRLRSRGCKFSRASCMQLTYDHAVNL